MHRQRSALNARRRGFIHGLRGPEGKKEDQRPWVLTPSALPLIILPDFSGRILIIKRPQIRGLAAAVRPPLDYKLTAERPQKVLYGGHRSGGLIPSPLPLRSSKHQLTDSVCAHHCFDKYNVKVAWHYLSTSCKPLAATPASIRHS